MAKSFRNWMTTQFEHDELADIANHSASAGFSGLIYYSETTTLYNTYKKDIWDMLYEDAESASMTIPALIASFHGAASVGDDDQLENLLVWYAAERVAWEVTQGEYQRHVD